MQGRQGAEYRGFPFSGRLRGKNWTSKDNRCRLKDRKYLIFVLALTGYEPYWDHARCPVRSSLIPLSSCGLLAGFGTLRAPGSFEEVSTARAVLFSIVNFVLYHEVIQN